MKAKITILLFTIINALSPVVAGGIETEELKIFREGDKVMLSFSVYIPEKTVKTDRRLLVTPQLYNDNGAASTNLFTITGKQMEKREKQKKLLNKDNSATYANTSNGSVMLYNAVVPYEAWMNNALSLRLLVTEEGCCEEEDWGVVATVGSVNLPLPYAPVLPDVMLPEPSQTAQMANKYPFLHLVDKVGDGDRSTSVRFRVSSSELDLSFSSNAENVEKILEGIRLINSDERAHLEKITIAGYASPEGTRKHNLELSENRAKALSRYLQQEASLPLAAFEIQPGGENWAGLLELVVQSNMEYKGEIIDIVTNQPAEKRNDLLKKLGGGRPYQSIYDVIYPQLRDACYINVWYSEKKDEAADIINNAISQIATLRYDDALESLFAVEHDPRSWNVIGTCYILQGNYPEARIWLQKAVEVGNKEAVKNLGLIN